MMRELDYSEEDSFSLFPIYHDVKWKEVVMLIGWERLGAVVDQDDPST